MFDLWHLCVTFHIDTFHLESQYALTQRELSNTLGQYTVVQLLCSSTCFPVHLSIPCCLPNDERVENSSTEHTQTQSHTITHRHIHTQSLTHTQPHTHFPSIPPHHCVWGPGIREIYLVIWRCLHQTSYIAIWSPNRRWSDVVNSELGVVCHLLVACGSDGSAVYCMWCRLWTCFSTHFYGLSQ